MSLDPNQEKLRVTLDDLSTVDTGIAQAATEVAPAPGPGSGLAQGLTPGTKSYGNINSTPDDPTMAQEKASILLQGWFYLGVAGMIGTLAGWAITEHAFVDG